MYVFSKTILLTENRNKIETFSLNWPKKLLASEGKVIIKHF